MDKNKVPIELKPYTALSILSFCREFINEDDIGDDYKFKAIKECVDEFEKEVCQNITDEQIEDARVENQVNIMIGKSPNARGL